MLKQKIKNALLWAQKYTHTDNIYLAKQGGFLWGANIINLALSFALSVAFARFITQETYGTFQYILSLVGILTIFTVPAMLDALTQATSAGADMSIFKATRIRIKFGFLGTLGAIIAGLYFTWHGRQDVAIGLFIASVFIPFTETFKNYHGYLGGKKRFDISSKYSVISQIIYSSVMMTTLLFLKNVAGLITVFFLINLLINACFYFRTLKVLPPATQTIDPGIASYGIHLTISSVFSVIASQIDRVLVFSFLGPQNLAIYTFATAPVDKIKGFLSPIGTLALPKFSEKSREEVKRGIYRRMWQLTGVTAIIVIGWIIAAPFLYRWFFPAYIASIGLSQLYILKYVGLPASILTIVFTSQKMLKPIYFLNITGEIFLIVMYILLLAKFKLMGLVMAAIFVALYRSAVLLIFLKKM